MTEPEQARDRDEDIVALLARIVLLETRVENLEAETAGLREQVVGGLMIMMKAIDDAMVRGSR